MAGIGLRWRDRVSQVSGVMFWSAANAPRPFCLSLPSLSIYLSLFLDGEGVCFHPESRELRTVTTPCCCCLRLPNFFSRVFVDASRLRPLRCTMAKAGTRTERELSSALALVYTPKSCFFVLPLSTFFYFFSPQLLSKHTHKKERKKEQSNADWCPCVCTFRDFRVRGGHLKPFPSRKKKKKRQISNKPGRNFSIEFQNFFSLGEAKSFFYPSKRWLPSGGGGGF